MDLVILALNGNFNSKSLCQCSSTVVVTPTAGPYGDCLHQLQETQCQTPLELGTMR